MKTALSLAVALLLSRTAEAGDITGTVRAKGKTDADEAAAGGAYESRKFKFAERVDYEEFKDFVVYIEGTIPGAKPPTQASQVVTEKDPNVVAQKDATFKPHVLPVMVGTKVLWPNYDDIYHNVFSKSKLTSFDLDLYKKGDPPKPVLFDKPGQVDVFCSIHAKMNCIVLVLENPYFASVNEKHRYSITNVPAGHYKLTAWHERLPNLTQEVDVPEKGSINVDFLMGIKNLPKY